MQIVTHLINNAQISQRLDDGYINLTQMAKASGKRLDNWKRLGSTTSLLREFSETPEYQGLQPLIAVEGFNGGTYGHPDIAIQFAQWCSPSFALAVSRIVRDWLTSSPSPSPQPDPTKSQVALPNAEQLEFMRSRAWEKAELEGRRMSWDEIAQRSGFDRIKRLGGYL